MSAGGALSVELEELRVQVARLQAQLAEEQQLRRQAEASVEALAADRARLQRARDELATALLVAEKRAADAEEEQLGAEEAAASLAQQLREQQHAAEAAAAAAAAAAGAAGGGGSGQAAAGESQGVGPANQQNEQVGAGRGRRDSQTGDAGLAADVELLLAELDKERQRSEELLRTLEAAEKEAVSATEKWVKAQQRIKQLESSGGGGAGGGKAKGFFGGIGSGMSRSGSAANLAAAAAAGEATPAAAAGGGAGQHPNGAAAAAAAGALVADLQQRIAALKASRDKLIGAFDGQAAEIERLSGDNAALTEALTQLRDVAAKWEAQAQDSLSQNERLKDLLEESAMWDTPGILPGASVGSGASGAGGGTAAGNSAAGGAAPAAGAAGGTAAEGGVSAPGDAGAVANGSGGSGVAGLAERCQRFEKELLMEKARSAQLDLQVRALCMELTRAAQCSSQMQSALMPMLGGIEARLVQVLGMKPRAAALQAATS